MPAYRPVITGTRHMVSAGHHAAAHAGFTILEAGGNAIDAGVAAGIALGVLQTDRVNFAGVAPIMIYVAKERSVVNIDGLGTWPRAASLRPPRVLLCMRIWMRVRKMAAIRTPCSPPSNARAVVLPN